MPGDGNPSPLTSRGCTISGSRVGGCLTTRDPVWLDTQQLGIPSWFTPQASLWLSLGPAPPSAGMGAVICCMQAICTSKHRCIGQTGTRLLGNLDVPDHTGTRLPACPAPSAALGYTTRLTPPHPWHLGMDQGSGGVHVYQQQPGCSQSFTRKGGQSPGGCLGDGNPSPVSSKEVSMVVSQVLYTTASLAHPPCIGVLGCNKGASCAAEGSYDDLGLEGTWQTCPGAQ